MNPDRESDHCAPGFVFYPPFRMAYLNFLFRSYIIEEENEQDNMQVQGGALWKNINRLLQ